MGSKWSERSFDSKMAAILLMIVIFGSVASISLGLFCLFNGHSLLLVMPFVVMATFSLVLREFYAEVSKSNITDKSLRQTIFKARTLKALILCVVFLTLFGVLLAINPYDF